MHVIWPPLVHHNKFVTQNPVTQIFLFPSSCNETRMTKNLNGEKLERKLEKGDERVEWYFTLV